MTFEDIMAAAERAASPMGQRQPIDTAPRDGTIVILWVDYSYDGPAGDRLGEHPLFDSANELIPTIGHNNYDNDGEDRWLLAGWDWCHDQYTQGRGTPVLWEPFPQPFKPDDEDSQS